MYPLRELVLTAGCCARSETGCAFGPAAGESGGEGRSLLAPLILTPQPATAMPAVPTDSLVLLTGASGYLAVRASLRSPPSSPSLVIIRLTPTSLVQTSSPSSSSVASVSGALCAARTRATTSRSSSQRTASTPSSRSPSSRTSRRCVPPPVPPRRDLRADSCLPVRSLMLSTRPSRASTPSCTPVRPSPPLLLARTRSSTATGDR